MVRISAGFKSAKDAALALGISPTHLRDIERGAKGASAELIERMSQVYRAKDVRIMQAIDEAKAAYHGRMLAPPIDSQAV